MHTDTTVWWAGALRLKPCQEKKKEEKSAEEGKDMDRMDVDPCLQNEDSGVLFVRLVGLLVCNDTGMMSWSASLSSGRAGPASGRWGQSACGIRLWPACWTWGWSHTDEPPAPILCQGCSHLDRKPWPLQPPYRQQEEKEIIQNRQESVREEVRFTWSPAKVLCWLCHKHW